MFLSKQQQQQLCKNSHRAVEWTAVKLFSVRVNIVILGFFYKTWVCVKQGRTRGHNDKVKSQGGTTLTVKILTLINCWWSLIKKCRLHNFTTSIIREKDAAHGLFSRNVGIRRKKKKGEERWYKYLFWTLFHKIKVVKMWKVYSVLCVPYNCIRHCCDFFPSVCSQSPSL